MIPGLGCWKRDRLPTPVFLGFPCGLAGKESTCNAGGLGLIPGLGRSPGEGKGYPVQYFGLENSMEFIVRGVTKSWTRLSDFHFSMSQLLAQDILMLKVIHCFSRIQIYLNVLYFYLLGLATLCLKEFPIQAEHKNLSPFDTRL